MKFVILCISLVFYAVPALAVTYTWEDSQGTVNFTEDLGNVPPQYRKKVKIVGEEELTPSVSEEAGSAPEPPPAQKFGKSSQGAPPAAGIDLKKVYGSKDLSAWKAGFAALDGDVKAAEKQLVELRSRMKDTSKMSRTEYLSIHNTIREVEDMVVLRRQKRDDFKQQAVDAGVPDGVFESGE